MGVKAAKLRAGGDNWGIFMLFLHMMSRGSSEVQAKRRELATEGRWQRGLGQGCSSLFVTRLQGEKVGKYISLETKRPVTQLRGYLGYLG